MRRIASIYSPALRHRLLQVGVDGALIAAAYLLAFVLRFEDGGMPNRFSSLLEETIAFVIVGKLVVFAAFGLYHKWWRYVGLRDLAGIARAVILASVILYVVLWLVYPTSRELPRSVAALDFLLTLVLILGARVVVRTVAERPLRQGLVPGAKDTLIVGAGDGGVQVVREMLRNRRLGSVPVGFVDDDPRKSGMRVNGLKVLGSTDQLGRILDDVAPAEVIIAIPSAPGVLRQKVVSACRERDIPVRTLPTVFELLEGKIDLMRQVRKVEVEDVLGRQPVHLAIEEAGPYVTGRDVMVTGAGGSIGSELCRQIAHLGAGGLILVDHAEAGLFEIERELVEDRHYRCVTPILADCKDRDRMASIFAQHRPRVVFHAAAYKHVPLTESNPAEAIRNNAMGTRAVADVAAASGVTHFVLVSTDKAVKPRTVMGASKALAERSIELAAARHPETRFAAVRFGNVLGSSGSVVPTFRRQIAAGGPVTVTHPDMTRYFMTIPEAVQLIIRAGGMDGTPGGSIFVLEMGDPVKIMDLARNMIRLSGHAPGADIAIEIVGPRAGEKIHEDLFEDDENPTATEAEKIMRAARARFDSEALAAEFDELAGIATAGDDETLVRRALEMAQRPPRSARGAAARAPTVVRQTGPRSGA